MLFVWCILFVGALVLVGCAHAASPEYCKFYSREKTTQFVNGLTATDRSTFSQEALHLTLDRWYARCLNSDEDPPVTLSGDRDWVEAQFLQLLAKVPLPPGTQLAVTDHGTAEVREALPAQVGPSGGAPGSTKWANWCTRHFKTFDPKTGTVRMARNRKPVQCPG